MNDAPEVPALSRRQFLLDELRRVLGRYARIGLLLLFVPIVLGQAARSHWQLELFTHFWPVYWAAAVAGTVALLLARDWRFLPVGLLLLSVCGFHVLPWHFGRAEASTDAGPALRILLANVLTSNEDYTRIVRLVERERPDIVVAQETNDAWVRALAVLRSDYPYVETRPREDNFGMALYSRVPFKDLRTVTLDRRFFVEALVATLSTEVGTVSFMSVHTLPPFRQDYAMCRNIELDAVRAWAVLEDNPVIIAGDLNTTPWSPYYADLIDSTGLRNTRQGFGVLGTWPNVPGWLAIPLDHILVSHDFKTIAFRRGPDIGSDHRPIIADLQRLPPDPPLAE